MRIAGGSLPVGMRIGFGGTQYTLWNIGPEIDGVQEANYHQNIGTDLVEVKAKYPNLPITDLKGETWAYREPQVKHDQNTDYFKFGRYSDQKFTDIDDTDYKKWYASEDNWNQTLHDHMVTLGYMKVEDTWMTEEEAVAEIEEQRLRVLRDNRTVEGMFFSNFNVDCKDILFATEEEESAIRYSISYQLQQQLIYASYNAWDWGYLPELAKRRSMKNQLFTVTFKDRLIVKIEKA